MKAISLLQPWASLVVIGAKKLETRGWYTQERGRICIHASLSRARSFDLRDVQPFKKYIDSLGGYENLGYGYLIGEVGIDSIIKTEDIRAKLSVEELVFGDYSTGRWAWRLTHPVKYKKAIACKGNLNLWQVPGAILNQLNSNI